MTTGHIIAFAAGIVFAVGCAVVAATSTSRRSAEKLFPCGEAKRPQYGLPERVLGRKS